jgi:superoxide dismutase, Cu-Zn family
MKTMNKILLCLSFAAAAAATGCGSDDESGGKELMNATGPWTVFPQAAGAANPAQGIAGSAKAVETSPGQMKVELHVTGVTASRAFGAHLHKLACDDTMAGGHYQHMAGGANDPMFANAVNEAWLDFTTDASGKGDATTMVAWVPAAAAAKAIVVHAMATMAGTMGTAGMAGPKLACLPVTFK